MIIIGCGECENTALSRHISAIKLRDELLRAYLDIENPKEKISYLASGRPTVNIKGVDISVSHSQNAVMAGVCISSKCECKRLEPLTVGQYDNIAIFDVDACRIGVDIEALGSCSRLEHYQRIARRCFSPSERERLSGITDKSEYINEFLALWTAKESICKMWGLGLSALRRADTTIKGDYGIIKNEKVIIGKKPYYIGVCAQTLGEE